MFSLRGNDPFREAAVQKYGIQNPEMEYGIWHMVSMIEK